MEEKIILEEEKSLPKKPKFKEKKCKVIKYNPLVNTLDVDFDGYGIRLYDIKKVYSDFVFIKYRGKIGNANFECKL